MAKNWSARLFLTVLAVMLISGCRTNRPVEKTIVLPYLPSNEYALYCFNDILPHPVGTGAPEVLDGVKKETVSLSDEVLKFPGFFRQNRSRSAVLVSEFDSPAKGIMTIGCDAEGFLKVECNGKVLLDHWQTAPASGTLSKYNNVITVPVRKGRNVLVFTTANGSRTWRFTAGSIPESLLPTAENLLRLNELPSAPDSRAHRSAELLMDQGVRAANPGVFRGNPVPKGENPETIYAQNPVLKVADTALLQVLNGLSNTKVAPGEIAVWQLGPSGLIVKTPQTAFGIDLTNPRAELLAPKLDALFLSSPEYSSQLLMKEMTRTGKPVFSAFFRSGKMLKSPASFRIKDLSVNSLTASSLNRKDKSTTVYRIICGKESDAPVLLYAGKIGRADLLRSATETDLFVIHAANAPQIPAAVRTLSPGLTLISGLWELGVGEDAPLFSTGTEALRRSLQQEGFAASSLLWGENLRLSSKTLRRKARPAALRYENALDAPFSLTGFPWRKSGEALVRLPDTLTEKEVPEKVLEQARRTAGGVIRFRTDSPEIALRAQCGAGENCAMDLYEEIAPGKGRLCGTLRARHTNAKGEFLQGTLFRNPKGKLRAFALYLPSGCEVFQLEIGVAGKAQLLPPLPQTVKKPIVFCGGTATQGGSASHPANSFTAILCRALDAPQVNLGFAGGSQASPAVAQLIAALDPAALVLEFDPALAPELQERFFRTIREIRPELPVILIGDCCQSAPESAAALRRIYENALGRGDRRIRLIEGKELFAPYAPDDCCVDRNAPSDLGFRLISRRILPVLRSCLPTKGK